MTKIPLSTFLPDITITLPGCPLPVIEHSVIRVLAYFGRETRYETETLAAVGVVAGQADYVLTPSDAHYQVVRIERVRLNGIPLDPVTVDELDAEYEGWRDESGLPRLYTMQDGDAVLTLVPTPDTSAAASLVVEVSITLAPSTSPTEFNSTLYDKFGDGLAAGICSRLLMTPGKDWTSPDLAAVHAQAYALVIAQAKDEVDRRQTRARQRARSYYR